MHPFNEATLFDLFGEQSLTPESRRIIITLGSALEKKGYRIEIVERLLRALDSWDDAIALLQTLNDLADSGTGWKALSALIDESCYSLADWARAIVCFLKWEGTHSSTIEPASMLAYLCCSAEAAANSPILLPFEEQVEEMLETFGYEGNN